MREDDGTMACCFDWKKSRNDWRIWAEVIGRGPPSFVPRGRDYGGQGGLKTENGGRGGKT
jgi:hypothetical protein